MFRGKIEFTKNDMQMKRLSFEASQKVASFLRFYFN